MRGSKCGRGHSPQQSTATPPPLTSRDSADSVADRCTRYADEHKYRVGDTLVIPVGFGAMVNHSPVPNMAKVVDASGLYLEALRDIDANEELSFAYDPRALDRFGLTRA